mgnify:FL=1|jgi:hypothetical protein
MSWMEIIKQDQLINNTYKRFKEQNAHLWMEASQLAGQGEVATLDSIVLSAIKENLNKPNMLEIVKIAAENYILKDW